MKTGFFDEKEVFPNALIKGIYQWPWLMTLIILFSILSNTSFINMGHKGLPLAFLLFPIALLTDKKLFIDKRPLALFFLTALSLTLHFFLVGLFRGFAPEHYVFNVVFAFLFLLMLSLLRRYAFENIAKAVILIVTLFFVTDSGLAIINHFLHTHLTLNYLANNPSFGIRIEDIILEYNRSGFVRITGPWSEPAYSILPLCSLLFCLYVVWNKLAVWQRSTVVFSCLLYLKLAGARSFVMLFASFLLCWVVMRLLRQKCNFENPWARMGFVFGALCIISLIYLLLTGVIIDSCQFTDGSFRTRFGSMQYATDAFLKHPLGLGPKSVAVHLAGTDLPLCVSSLLSSQVVIHSLLMQPLFELGLFALPLLFFPFLVVAHYCTARTFQLVLPFLLSLYVVGIFTTDYTFFSGYWFIFTLFCLFAIDDRKRSLFILKKGDSIVR